MDPSRVQPMIDQMNKQLAAEGNAPFQWKTIPQGAATSVWACVVAPADEIGGRYCENCHVGEVVPEAVTISAISEGVRGCALDPSSVRLSATCHEYPCIRTRLQSYAQIPDVRS
jgi:hypothetical protein